MLSMLKVVVFLASKDGFRIIFAIPGTNWINKNRSVMMVMRIKTMLVINKSYLLLTIISHDGSF